MGNWETSIFGGKKHILKTHLKKNTPKAMAPVFRFLHISPKAMGQAGEDEEMAKWMDYSLQRGVPRFLFHVLFTWRRKVHGQFMSGLR